MVGTVATPVSPAAEIPVMAPRAMTSTILTGVGGTYWKSEVGNEDFDFTLTMNFTYDGQNRETLRKVESYEGLEDEQLDDERWYEVKFEYE